MVFAVTDRGSRETENFLLSPPKGIRFQNRMRMRFRAKLPSGIFKELRAVLPWPVQLAIHIQVVYHTIITGARTIKVAVPSSE